MFMIHVSFISTDKEGSSNKNVKKSEKAERPSKRIKSENIIFAIPS